MAYACVNGTELFYTDEGKGPPLLLVHGWGCDSHDWNWQLAHFARRHRVLAVDLRGHGRSQVTEYGYTPAGFAADLAVLVRQRACGPVVAIGHSLGGVVVNVLAAEHPRLVRGVIGLDPAYGESDAERRTSAALLRALRIAPGRVLAASAFAQDDDDGTPQHLRVWHRRRALGMPHQPFIQSFASLYEGPDAIAPRAGSALLLARRRCPFLSVYMARRRDCAEWENSLRRHSADRVVCLDTGHWPHQQRPELLNTMMDEWMASLEAPVTAK